MEMRLLDGRLEAGHILFVYYIVLITQGCGALLEAVHLFLSSHFSLCLFV